MKHNIILSSLSLVLMACNGEVIPKPRGFLQLEFPQGKYQKFESDCSFQFFKNKLSVIKKGKDCSMQLEYLTMNGSIYLTYKPIRNNLNKLLVDAQRLSYEHVIKADNIIEQPFINQKDKVYGMFYEVTGNAASQSQFYVTDSLNHFVTGSLYFYAKPNYDSIYPAVIYLQKDIRKIMETLSWKE